MAPRSASFVATVTGWRVPRPPRAPPCPAGRSLCKDTGHLSSFPLLSVLLVHSLVLLSPPSPLPPPVASRRRDLYTHSKIDIPRILLPLFSLLEAFLECRVHCALRCAPSLALDGVLGKECRWGPEDQEGARAHSPTPRVARSLFLAPPASFWRPRGTGLGSRSSAPRRENGGIRNLQ